MKINTENEDVDVWKYFLESKDFESAIQYAHVIKSNLLTKLHYDFNLSKNDPLVLFFLWEFFFKG